MFRKLQELDPGGAQKLATEVKEKASGVFLWVRLVVMSLLEGLRDGDTMTHPREKLRELPPDLETLFREILDQLEPPHLHEASRILRVALATSEEPISLLAISFVNQSIQEAFSSEIKTEKDPADIAFRAELARRRLSSRCKGLLEAPTFHADGADTKVQFLHRTVRDFIQREDIEATIHGVEKDFDPYEAICTCQILNLKTRGLDPSPEFTAAFYQAAVLSESIQSTDDAFKAAVVIELKRISNTLHANRIAVRSIPQSNHEGPSSQARPWLDGGLPSFDKHGFFNWAIDRNLFSYIRQTAPSYSLNTSDVFDCPLIHALGLVLETSNSDKSFELIKILLENGADPNYRPGKVSESPWGFITGLYVNRREVPWEIPDHYPDLLDLLSRSGADPPLYTTGRSKREIITLCRRLHGTKRPHWYDGLVFWLRALLTCRSSTGL